MVCPTQSNFTMSPSLRPLFNRTVIMSLSSSTETQETRPFDLDLLEWKVVGEIGPAELESHGSEDKVL
ncbi:hypothetical protein K1719_027060 [Acacia pycnantha]|nr:hypothetical protein K1719_027060 [Acacia pycnantha]